MGLPRRAGQPSAAGPLFLDVGGEVEAREKESRAPCIGERRMESGEGRGDGGLNLVCGLGRIYRLPPRGPAEMESHVVTAERLSPERGAVAPTAVAQRVATFDESGHGFSREMNFNLCG
jgi:hypothetical protein